MGTGMDDLGLNSDANHKPETGRLRLGSRLRERDSMQSANCKLQTAKLESSFPNFALCSLQLAVCVGAYSIFTSFIVALAGPASSRQK
jgi:hypothetical protein